MIRKRFYFQTDASKLEMEPVLYQLDDNGNRWVISYASAEFRPNEIRYHSSEQESLDVVWAVKCYRLLLENSYFTLRADNAALK